MSVQYWGSKRQVNLTEVEDHRDPHVATLEDGRFVVVWEDTTGSGTSIKQRLFHADGRPASGETVVYDGTVAGVDHTNPIVVPLDGGGWRVAALADGADTDLVTQHYDSDGNVGAAAFVFPAADIGVNPSLVRRGTEVLIGEVPAGANNELKFYESGASGTTFPFPGFTVQSDTTGTQDNLNLAVLETGNILAAWRDGAQIEYRMISSLLTPLTADTDATTATVPVYDGIAPASIFGHPGVTALSNGAGLITWLTPSSGVPFPGDSFDIWGRIIDPDGATYKGPILLNTTTRGVQYNPDVVALQDGGFLLIYLNNTSGFQEEIRVQKFDNFANRIGPELVLAQVALPGGADFISGTLLADGRVAVTWVEEGVGGSANPVVQQIIDPRGGSILGTPGAEMIYGSISDDNILSGSGSDTVYALNGNDFVIGGLGDDTLLGGLGDDQLDGLNGNDSLVGSYGSDTLNGGTGDDTMEGGNGHDTYIVDSASDVVTETGGLEDIDTVEVGFSFTLLGLPIENLMLTGLGAFNGTGNSLNNELHGNSRENILSGGGGHDMLFGNAGEDTLNGEAGNDTLEGGDNQDNLDGGTGADVMRGGDGADTYFVDNIGDVIEEVPGGSLGDAVFSTVDFAMPGSVEVLTLQGGAVTGRGNNQGNTINGNGSGNVIFGESGGDFIRGNGGSDALRGDHGEDTIEGGYGNDFIDGGPDADIMKGSNGNDIYVVDNAGDVIDETGGVADIDTVRSFVDFNLSGEPLEKLELQGAAAINGTGNSLNNEIKGNDAVNALDGGGGKDLLYGLGGADIFLFTSVANIGNSNPTRDVIFDFSQAENDRINLSPIDAIAGGGDDAFNFIGAGAFSGTAGELRAVAEGPNTRVEGDIFGNGTADFQIALIGSFGLTGADFIL